MKNKILNLNSLLFILLSCSFFIFTFLGVTISGHYVIGGNITNATVIARVNVSNTEPTLYKVEMTHPALPIDLTPGGATVVTCNGSVYDINGYDDIKNVTATFYDITVASDAADDNNTHYSNTSCGQCTAIPGTSNQNGSCLCNFPVQYYANVGNWQCNMTVSDSFSLNSSENSSFVRINEVLGIDVETTSFDYGNLSVTQTSDPIRENITNIGNIAINVTLRGFGGDNESIGQNVTMICELGTNITFDYQRYSLQNDTLFANMLNLTNQTKKIANLKIPKRTTNAGYGNSSNSTFWRLQIPLSAAGICNGTIIFGAIDATES